MIRTKEKLKAMREELGLTQEEAARKLFVSLPTYSRFEREGPASGKESKNNFSARYDLMALMIENNELRGQLK